MFINNNKNNDLDPETKQEIRKLKEEINNTKFEILWESEIEFKKTLSKYLKILKGRLNNLKE